MTHRVVGFNFPAGGGGTFRQFPLEYTRSALRRAEGAGTPGTFYIHPWEVDPDQPRVLRAPFLTRLRHYRGLKAARSRLEALVDEFDFRPMRETAAAVRNRTLTLLMVAVLSACVDTPWTGTVEHREGGPPEIATCPVPTDSIEVDEVARGLETPWDMAEAPDGRIFLTERPGRIRVIEDGVLREDPWATLNVEETPGLEIGLMGIALAPDFEASGHLFVVSTHLKPEPLGGLPGLGWLLRRIQLRLPGDRGVARVNRIHRITDHEGSGSEPTLWVDELPSGVLHSGGALLVTPDRSLLLSLGDGGEPWTAQDPRSLRGTLLRVPSTDRPPPANRLDPQEHVVAMGVRNSQGMAFLDPDSSIVVFIDHGPSGLPAEEGRREKDELNLLRIDAMPSDPNYGWPVEAGISPEPRFERPVHEWSGVLAPAGLAVLPGDGRGGSIDGSARVLVTGLRGQSLSQVEFARSEDSGEWAVQCEMERLGPEWGRLRAIAAVGDGELYVSTSNRDGRGTPREGDDRILRIRWPSSSSP